MRDFAAATYPIYRLIPSTRVRSAWLPSGDRVELLRLRYENDPLFRRIIVPLTPKEKRWERYRLDPRASRIYALIDGYRTVADLVDIYRDEFPDDVNQIESRIYNLLRSLEAHGFVSIKEI